MTYRKLEIATGGRDAPAIMVHGLADFIEAAGRFPRRIAILRTGAPVTTGRLRSYCLALGGILEWETAGEIRTVRNDPSIPDSTAMSLRPLPLHSDGSFLPRPPARFMLSFVRVDRGGGGLSTFMPVSEVLAAAPERVLDALLGAEFLFPRGYDDLTDSYRGPVLYRDGAALNIRWRSDDVWRPRVIDAHGTDATGAVDWLHGFLRDSDPLTYLAEVGDTLLIPNGVLLHGRTGLSPDSDREILRVWVADPPASTGSGSSSS
jgi:Taurine catabolism dioxygenase TauD, TfdA family